MGKQDSEKAYFNRLPKVLVTERALNQLDMQNRHKGAPGLVIAQDGPHSEVKNEFASNGGPRLRWMQGASDLKGIPSAVDLNKTVDCFAREEDLTMVPIYSNPDSTLYDANFELYLQQQGIFRDSTRFPDPRNLQEICNRVFEARNDERPPGSDDDDECFRRFSEMNGKPKDPNAMRTVMPTIAGPKTHEEVYGTLFDNIEPIGYFGLDRPAPGIFDGARLCDLDEDVCDELRLRIIPSTWRSDPSYRHRIVPNWFAEARIGSAFTDVCKRQLCYAGAYGARAMHALQNYGRSPDEQIYDGNAYTYSAVYVVESRLLEIFAHHMARAANGQEQYLMTSVCEVNMTESKESFQRGTNAFRNARDMAREHRDAFIKETNDRAAEKRGKVAVEQQSMERERSEITQDEIDNARPGIAEPSSLPEAALRKGKGEDALKRARPDVAVEGDEAVPPSKRR